MINILTISINNYRPRKLVALDELASDGAQSSTGISILSHMK